MFSISRTIVVRATGTIDVDGISQLDSILRDLIHEHGITDLVLDLSAVVHIDPRSAGLLDWVQDALTKRGGMLELRLPTVPSEDLIGMSADIPSFISFASKNKAADPDG
jgi:hypothetical protein